MKIRELCSPGILKGKVTVVTGAGRGLGKAMASALAEAGSHVVLVARTLEEIERTAKELTGMGHKALAVKTDVTNRKDVSKMVEQIRKACGKIDVLVNNAGQNASYVHHRFEDIPEDEWTSMIQMNVNSVFMVTKYVGRLMIAQGTGKIINIASSMGIRAVPERICYGVSKAAIIHLTKALAVEWASLGITVNCIAPGSFDRLPDRKDEAYLKMNEERRKRIPLGRLGRLEELGPLLVFLASNGSDYMTGETIFIDGGMSIG